MQIISHNLAETADLAAKILAELVDKKQTDQATLVVLRGDLGAGKTTFTQAVARALGVTGRVTSPTFVIMKNYKCQWQGLPLPSAKITQQGESLLTSKDSPCWSKLIHIDCYRLDGPEDLRRLGWGEIAADPQNLILVEWPERVGDLLSTPTLKINFEGISETSRKIIYG